MGTTLVSELSAGYQKKFISNVFFNVGIAFFVYFLVVYYVSLSKITLPLLGVFFLNKTSSFICFCVYSVLAVGIYWLFNSNQDDFVKICGYGTMIGLRALYISPLLILLAYFHPNILKEAFIEFAALIAYLSQGANQAVINKKELNFLDPIIQLGGIFLVINALLGMLFGFDVGLLYVFLAILVYSAAFLVLMYCILKGDAELFEFTEGDVLSASFCMFSLLEALYLCLVFVLIAGLASLGNS